MTIQQINDIKKQTNGDFVKLVSELQACGVIKFQTCASTAKSMYFDSEENTVYDQIDFFNFPIGNVNKQQFIDDLKRHQQGMSDFPTWLEQTAASGIGYWIVDLMELTCTYYDLAGNSIYVEEVRGQ